MSSSKIETKSITDSSINQKKESFRHWYLRHLFTNPVILIIVILGSGVLIVINMINLALVGNIVDLVVFWIGDISEGLSLLNGYILTILILYLIRFLCSTLIVSSNSWSAWNANRRIKDEFFDLIQNKPMKFHDSVRTGEIISLGNIDTGQIVEFIDPGLRILMNAIFSFSFSVFFFVNVLNAPILFICLIPFLVGYIWTFIRF